MTAPKTLGKHLGVNLEMSDDVAQHKLGTVVELDGGGRAIYVLANTALTGEGYAVLFDTAFGVDQITTTNADAKLGRRVGVAQCAVSAGDYCWVVIHGQTQLRVSASCAANAQLATTATAGELDDATTSGLSIIGGVRLLAARGGTAGNALAELVEAHVSTEIP